MAKLGRLDTILPFISYVGSILGLLMTDLFNVWKQLQFKKWIQPLKNDFYYVGTESNDFSKLIKISVSIIYKNRS